MKVDKRDIMLESQNILDALFFGENPVFTGVMDDVANQHLATREDKITVLLIVFALKEYRRIAEAKLAEAEFLDEILHPRQGETVH